MKIKNLIRNVLVVVGIYLFAGCGGYCDAGNFTGAVLALVGSVACIYPSVKEFEREEAQKNIVRYRHYIDYKSVGDREYPRAQ